MSEDKNSPPRDRVATGPTNLPIVTVEQARELGPWLLYESKEAPSSEFVAKAELVRNLAAQMQADKQERERLRGAIEEARKALYSNVECDCRDTLTFDCWKCNLMRTLNQALNPTPPPTTTAPSRGEE